MIGGAALEFYWRAGLHYGLPQYLQDIAWYVEPKVAEAIFRQMLDEAGVAVLSDRRLRERDGVQKQGARLAAITMENGARFAARVFADATYEGDLMAQAGVTYTWGRESSAQYGESLAGVRGETPFHQFLIDISPVRAQRQATARDLRGSRGRARRRRQESPGLQLPHDLSPTIRPTRCLTRSPRTTTRRGSNWRRGSLDAMAEETGPAAAHGRGAFHRSRSPTRRPTSTTTAPFSTDYIGKSWDYPEAELPAPRRDLAGPRRVHEGLLLLPRARPARADAAAEGGQRRGVCQGRIHRHRQLAPPALYPRGAPDGRRVRDDPAGHPDRPRPSRTPSAWAPTTAIRTTWSA